MGGRVAASLSISRAWDQTRETFRRDGKLITSVALALVVLPVAVGVLLAPAETLSGVKPPAWAGFVSLAVAFLGIVGQLAIIRLAFPPSTSVQEAMTHGFRRFIPAFAALFLLGLLLVLIAFPIILLFAGGASMESLASGEPTPAVAKATLVIVLVALLLGARFQLLMPIASAEGGNPFQILKRSWALSKGNYWRLLAFVLLSLVLAVVLTFFLGQVFGGLIARTIFGDIAPFSIGALIAGLASGLAQAAFSIIVSIMLASIYSQLAGGGAEASVPSSGT